MHVIYATKTAGLYKHVHVIIGEERKQKMDVKHP